MDEKKILEEQLREAACIGDTDAVQELINLGVDVNAKHAINGWTPLHWACKRNYLDVVALLLKSGADKYATTEKGESPASVSTNPCILQLLDAQVELSKANNNCKEVPSFVPNYLKNSPLHTKLDTGHSSQSFPTVCTFSQGEIVLKIRVANLKDPDFIEVDLPLNILTYQDLLHLCCEELGVNPSQVSKLRKLPNTKIRRDKDVQRLQNFQEIEVVLNIPISSDTSQKSLHANGNTIPITPTNHYQSISKKDQTILY